MVVRDTGGEFELPPGGLWPAFCVNWFDVGIRPGFEGKPTHKVIGLFELVVLDESGHEVRMSSGEYAGKRFLITKEYTMSLNEGATLSVDLTGWRGREFTPEERAGFDLDVTKRKMCTLSVAEYTKRSGKPGVKVVAIAPAQRPAPAYQPETPDSYVPDWIRRLMAGATRAPIESQAEGDYGIPF